MERKLAAIRLRAKRRIGELSAQLDNVQGENLPNVPRSGSTTKTATLKAAGISTSEAGRCEQIARVPQAAFEEYLARAAVDGQAVLATDVLKAVAKQSRKCLGA